MAAEIELVMHKLDAKLDSIKADIEFIKEHMVDVDTLLTLEEEKIIDESLKELEDGKTTSHEQLKKEIGLE